MMGQARGNERRRAVAVRLEYDNLEFRPLKYHGRTAQLRDRPAARCDDEEE
jgi:hypothetical protein